MTVTTYHTNNSGGSWWLSDDDWYALEECGWKVDWVKDNEYYKSWNVKDRWLGALATSASREGISFRRAIQEWESITGENANSLGCQCCGVPHSFSSDTGEFYAPEYPSHGESY